MAVLQLRSAREQLRIAPQAFKHIQQQLYPVEYIAQEHVGDFCFPQSKCCCINEYLTNVLTQPSSGQQKIAALLSSSSICAGGSRSRTDAFISLSLTDVNALE